MTKQSTIKNLIVMPLIASAIFLASPTFAANPTRAGHNGVQNITNKAVPNTRKGIVGTVTGISGSSIVVTTKDNSEYAVDATNATIMKEGVANGNPALVQINEIKIGDSIVVRGELNDTEIND